MLDRRPIEQAAAGAVAGASGHPAEPPLGLVAAAAAAAPPG